MTDPAASPDAPAADLDALALRMAEALAAFRAAPTLVAEAALRERRNALARACLKSDAAGLRRMGAAPHMDRLLDLMRAGLRVQPLTDEETEILAAAAARLAAANDAGNDDAAILAFCLMRPAADLPRLPVWSVVTPPLLELLVRVLFAEPEFFVGRGEAERAGVYLERLTLGVLETVESDAPVDLRRALAQATVLHGRFLMAYFSERNLRALYRARARIIEFYLTALGYALDAAFPPRPADRPRVRVGVLRQGWVVGAETAATLAHINRLDRGRFELIAYSLMTCDDPVERVVRERVDRFTVLNAQNVAEAVRQIRADDLDLLLIGTNVTAITHFLVLLSAFRLARVQAALTLNPATTGFRSVDVFLNGALNEPEDAQAEYTEVLRLVPGSINHYDFSGEPTPADAAAGRAGFGLPDGAFVFASGANFYKLIPELLESWSRILNAVPGSRLALYPFNPNWTNVYPVEMFSRHLRGVFAQRGVDPTRIHILRPLPSRAHIHALLRTADAYLDSFPFSGAVSILDPVHVGCPVVLRVGRPARNRQSAGMHADLGLGAAATHSAQEYEAAAIRLATDRGAWTDLRVRALDTRERAGRAVGIDLGDALAALVSP